ncbi:MAG TPA: hypothetical protein VKR24_09165 [Candidatus Limnocylindrales bacterium]|nr:hypothetical protein [Candidatus Limnocylindrales bacterium]
MTRTIRRRLASVAAAALLIAAGAAPLGATGAVAAVSSPVHAAGGGPLRLVGNTVAHLYASGSATAPHVVTAHSVALGANGPARATRTPAGSASPTVRPNVAPNPVQATLTAAPDHHLAGFAGLGQADQASPSAEPAESTIAAGPDQTVQFANLEMRITDRAGASLGTSSIPSFFAVTAGFFDRDPRIVYDSLHSRFVAVETSWDCSIGEFPGDPAMFGHGYLDLAVSRTDDPRGTWDLYFWGYDDLVPSDPSVGTSTDKLAVSDDLLAMTHGDGGGGATCADPASLTAYAGDLQVAAWSDAIANKVQTLPSTEFAGGPPATVVGLRAVVQSPATSATLYVVARSVVDDGMGTVPDDVVVTTFGGLPSKTSNVSISASWDLTKDGIVAPFADPPAPHQPGSPATIVNATNGNIESAIWQGGRLAWATTFPCTPSGDSTQRDCVRLTEVNTSSAAFPTPDPTASQDLLIARNGFDSYVPGIAFAGDGTLDVVYTQSNGSGSNFPASYEQYHRSTDAANTLSAPVQIAAGSSTYSGSAWGAYQGLAPDPQVPTSVWQAGAFATGSGRWATFVDQLGSTTGGTYFPIVPVRVLDTRGTGSGGLSDVSGKFISSHARTFQVANLGAIPPGAVAVTGNLTVTRQTKAGYVSLTPTPQNSPTSSTLNFPVGDNRANNVTASLSSTGTLSATYVGGTGSTDLLFDVTGYFLANDTGATYHPVAPARLIDSRNGTGMPGGGGGGPGEAAKFQAGVPVTFTNFDGCINGNISPCYPMAATAITANLTVTNQTKAGYISITPDPTSMPVVSNLNFPLNDNRANGVTIAVNSSHSFAIVYIAPAGATADVIVDLTGYYLPDLTGLHFYPLNPGRVMDTRPAMANSGLTGAFVASTPRQLPVAGHWAVPADAEAITGNLTVTGQTAAGYASITTASDPNPETSSINFPLADDRANGVTVPLNDLGGLWLVYHAGTGKKTDLILDVTGYFR